MGETFEAAMGETRAGADAQAADERAECEAPSGISPPPLAPPPVAKATKARVPLKGAEAEASQCKRESEGGRDCGLCIDMRGPGKCESY